MNNFPTSKKIGLLFGPLAFLVLFFLPDQWAFISPEANKVIAVAAWMIIWWITETVSISVTALLPLTLFPLLNIMSIKAVAPNYSSPIVFLFFGGFVIALALEKVQLHKRIALNIIKLTGTSPDKIVLGFMLSTALMSMWISNTASTVVMLPIAFSVVNLLINDEDGFSKKDQNFALSIMLGIAFAANVGGIATIIGTPPNTVLAGILEETYDIQLSFFNWMLLGVPFAIIMLAVIYVVLVKWVYPNNLPPMENSKELIDSELNKLGDISKGENRVLIIFLCAVFLWVFRGLLNEYVPQLKLSDAGISLLAAVALFTIPLDWKNGKFPLDWKDTEKLPWGILILFGGGLALAAGLKNAGIIKLIGETVSGMDGLNTFLITSILITIMLFMTELMSNVALVTIIVPMVAGIAIGLDAEILHLVIPVTMASSCAFMLPMATPPNAIVFASGFIKVHQMARVGVILNIIAVLLLVIFTRFYIPLLF